MAQALKFHWLLCITLAAGLTGCSTTKNWFGRDEAGKQPAEETTTPVPAPQPAKAGFFTLQSSSAEETKPVPSATHPPQNRPLVSAQETARVSAVAPATGFSSVPEPSLVALMPGDRIQLDIANDTALSGPLTVDGNGDIALPLAGKIAVAGLSADAAEQAIIKAFSSGYFVDPHISVTPIHNTP